MRLLADAANHLDNHLSTSPGLGVTKNTKMLQTPYSQPTVTDISIKKSFNCVPHTLFPQSSFALGDQSLACISHNDTSPADRTDDGKTVRI
jgi:hypothetical protein